MLSIILPSYNGYVHLEKSVPTLTNYLTGKGVEFEIIIVDDGSTIAVDLTRQLAVQYNCIFIQNRLNLGKGASVKKGVYRAKGNIVLFTDNDLPFGVEIVENTYNLMINDKTIDLVIGDRTHKDSDYFKRIPPTRNFVSKVFSGIISYLILSERIDTQCGFKAFKNDVAKKIFNKITINRFAFDVEIIAIARAHNYTIKKVPVNFYSQQDGASVNILIQGFAMLRDLLKIRWKTWFGHYKL